MEKYRCKLFSRDFIDGRALGGHMKSHMMTLYAARKDPFDLKMKGADGNPSFSSTISDEENEEVDSCFDGESDETDSPKKKKYPCRVRKSTTCGFFQVKKSKRFEQEKGSNVSARCSILDPTPEEDAACCLIMLSKDKWERDHKSEYRARIRNEEVEDQKRRGDDYSGSRSNKLVRGKYKCGACNKLFRSYQALGGHRASHKKLGAETGRTENSGGGSKAAAAAASHEVEEKVHECPFCPRVFESGQALGGHKRTHFLGISKNVIETIGPLAMKPCSRSGDSITLPLPL